MASLAHGAGAILETFASVRPVAWALVFPVFGLRLRGAANRKFLSSDTFVN
jgi:hypothetical protein